jgi:hypothetical protein
MSSEVWIVLIVASAVVIVLMIFRDRLAQFGLKANRSGIDVKLQNQPRRAPSAEPGGTVIRGNRQTGWRNRINIWRRAFVQDNVQRGVENEVVAGPDQVSNRDRESIGGTTQ